MIQETAIRFENPSGLPKDATKVLKDGKWHETMSGPSHMSMEDTKPWTFWIDSTPKEGPDTTLEDAGNQCYRVEFHKNPGSWGREGMDMVCKGRVVLGNNQVPAWLLVINDVAFFQLLKEPAERESIHTTTHAERFAALKVELKRRRRRGEKLNPQAERSLRDRLARQADIRGEFELPDIIG
jgi:hypothetical protein